MLRYTHIVYLFLKFKVGHMSFKRVSILIKIEHTSKSTSYSYDQNHIYYTY
jgi:hypothetical protein